MSDTTISTLGEALEFYVSIGMRAQKLAEKTRMSAIKALFTYLYGRRKDGIVIDEDAAAAVVPPKVKESELRYLGQEEYERLMLACSHHPREAAIIEMFLQTGLRLSELAGIKVGDIRFGKDADKKHEKGGGTVFVTRKGSGKQQIAINYKVCRRLHTYLKVRPEVDHDNLFVTRVKTPMSPRSIQHLVKKYMDEAGIKDASTHSLRHTMATQYLAKGVDVKTIQLALGHKRITTTERYLHSAEKVQRRAFQEHAL